VIAYDRPDPTALTRTGQAITDLDHRFLRYYLDTGRTQLDSPWPPESGTGEWPL
jgi:hypothetical protein